MNTEARKNSVEDEKRVPYHVGQVQVFALLSNSYTRFKPTYSLYTQTLSLYAYQMAGPKWAQQPMNHIL